MLHDSDGSGILNRQLRAQLQHRRLQLRQLTSTITGSQLQQPGAQGKAQVKVLEEVGLVGSRCAFLAAEQIPEKGGGL